MSATKGTMASKAIVVHDEGESLPLSES